MDIKVNYAGITRRIMAYLIDNIIILLSIPILSLSLMTIFSAAFENNKLGKDSFEMAADFLEPSLLLFTHSLQHLKY